MLPHLDEAYAALFGARRWAAYLDWSGSGALCEAASMPDICFRDEKSDAAGLSRWLIDFAPVPRRHCFDPASGRLVIANPMRRPLGRVALLDEILGPHQDAVMEAMRAAALAPLGPGLVLADPGFDWTALPDWAIWRFERLRPIAGSSTLLGVEGREEPYCSGLARLVGEAAFIDADRAVCLNDPIDDLADEAFLSLVEGVALARSGARAFEALRRENGYKLEEPLGERLSSSAGAQLAVLVHLAAARLPGFADMLRRADRDGPESEGWPARVLAAGRRHEGVDVVEPPRPDLALSLPNLVLPECLPLDAGFDAFRRPVLSKDALDAAFFALHGVAPEALADYEPCDLAAGAAHLRQMAYALVAVDAVRAGIEPDAADPRAAAEMAFWIAGVDIPANGRARCYGLAPCLGAGRFAIEAVREEPAGVMATIHTTRAKAGLDCADLDLVEAMRARQGPRSLPAYAKELDLDAEARARDFKHARARRILKEREAAGHVIADREPDPEEMPELGSPLDDIELRLVPEEQCLPKLRPHPNPRTAFQLEEPPFFTARRLARVRADQAAKTGSSDQIRVSTPIAHLVETIVTKLKAAVPEARTIKWQLDLSQDATFPVHRQTAFEILGVLVKNAAHWASGDGCGEVIVRLGAPASAVIEHSGHRLDAASQEAINRHLGWDERYQGPGRELAKVGDLVAAFGGNLTLSQRLGSGMCALIEWPISPEHLTAKDAPTKVTAPSAD